MLVWSHLGGTLHRLYRTLSNAEDAGGLPNFGIAGSFHLGADVNNLTEDSNSNALKIAVYTSRDITPPKRVTGFDLDSNNSAARGIWGNNDTFWVANDGTGATDKLYAHNRSDGSRDSSKDFDNLNGAGNNDIRGICSDGTTMFVADSGDDEVYAYKMSDTTRDSNKDVTLHSDNDNPQGLWCQQTLLWVAQDNDDLTSKIFVYQRSDGNRDSTEDIGASVLSPSTSVGTINNSDPRGLWSNGTTMFAVDDEDAKIYGYQMSDRTRDDDKNIALASANADPEGLWFDGRVLWVVDSADDKVYVYDLPGAQPGNDPADGDPAVLSVGAQPRVGEEVTADVSGITDDTDGLDNAFFHYQWIRVDGTDETELAGETGSTYTTTADDVEKHLKVRAAFDDGVGYREYPRTSLQVGPVLEAPPEVTSVSLTSNPGSDSTYAIGDSVTATVTFNEAVDITGSPQITLLFGTAEKAANCAAATNTTTMACSHTVVADETAPTGVGIKENSLGLNGGTIYATGSTTNSAALAHSALALQSGHKVDGIRPTLVTTGSDAPRTSTDGAKIILTFAENLSSLDHTKTTFKVRAENDIHQGPVSNEATAVPVTVPSAPQSLAATAGNAKVRLDWSAPSSDGGNPIVGYEYRYRAGSGSFTAWANVPGSSVNTTSYTVTGLVNGTVHTFEVRARTATLESAAASATATPMAMAPDAPSVTVKSRHEALHVAWSVADDGGSNITEYQVQWKSGNQSFHTSRQQFGITGRSTTITGLSNGTAYQVRVRARNLVGWGDWSTVKSGTPQPKPAPTVTVTAGVTEPVTGPFRVTFTFTDTNLGGDERYDVVGFEAADIGAWYTSRGTEAYEFEITDFREETPGRVYSALVEDIIDGKLWIDVPDGAVQSSQDGQDNVFAFETWQVEAPDPAPADEGPAIWSGTLTVGGQYPDGSDDDVSDTGHMGYFIGWSKLTGRDERFGALPDNSFRFGGESHEVLELGYTPGWRIVRLRLCPRPMFTAARLFELRLGDNWLVFHGPNMSTWDFGRTKDGARQQCREYNWGPVTLDWEYGDSIIVRITR